MSDSMSNSNKYKDNVKKKEQENKKIEKVTTGKVTTKPAKKTSKLRESFIADEASNLGLYLWNDVLVPTIKKTMVDLVSDSVNMLFYGTSKQTKGTAASTVSYSSIYKQDRFDNGRTSRTSRSPYHFDPIIFETRRDAEEVLSRMDEIIDSYGTVSVADMYDLVGKTGDYTSNNYGWVQLRGAEPVRSQGGYVIDLPKVTPL